MKNHILSIAVALAYLFLPCCQSNHHHEAEGGHHAHEHEHEHEHEPVLLLTAYSQSFELFAESHPLVTGEEAPVRCHITSLEDFKPYSGQSVTACLDIPGSVQTVTAEVSETEGIFLFELRPSSAGEGSIMFFVEDDTLVCPVKSFDNEEEAHEYAESLEVKSANGAAFPKEKSWKVDFATSEAKLEQFGQIIKTMSRVLPSQGEEVSLSALSDGIVSIPGGSLLEGREVKKGEILCKIIGSGMADGNSAVRFAKAEADYTFARNEYERKLELNRNKIVSDSELQKARTEYESAEALYNSLKNNFSKDGQKISSSISGYITSVNVSNGTFVHTGDVIATVSSNAKVNLVAEVQPRYSTALRSIAGATFKSMDGQSVWSLEELDGKVAGVGKSVSDSSPLLPVTFSVNNKVDFVPGSFVSTWIRTASIVPVVTVESSALVEELGNYFVYKQLTPEYFEKTPVFPGASDGLRTEITKGLSDGDRVVSKGAVLVKLAQASGALDPHAGHTH